MARPSKYEKVFAHKRLSDEDANEILRRAIAVLNEHFDTVVICATCAGPERTDLHQMQIGNDYAVLSMLEEGLLRSRICIDGPDDDEDEES